MWSWLATEQQLTHKRFTRFVDRLEPTLKDLALDTGTYLGVAENRKKMDNLPVGVSFIGLLPLFFLDAFPVNRKLVRKLTYCTTLGTLYALSVDKLIDSQVESTPRHIFLATSLFGEFQRSLMGIFGERSRFWVLHDRYFREHHSAELYHIYERTDPRNFSFLQYQQIAKAKSAPLKIALAGLAFIANRPALIKRLSTSIDDFLVGFQLYDDAMDWREDYLQNRSTPVTVRIASMMEKQELHIKTTGSNIYEVLVHSSDILETTLDESSRWFKKALKNSEGVDCGTWRKLLYHLMETNRKTTEELVSAKVMLLFGENNLSKASCEIA